MIKKNPLTIQGKLPTSLTYLTYACQLPRFLLYPVQYTIRTSLHFSETAHDINRLLER